ncbi:hypothetical protein D1007_35007 [Hordeum vulgare]|nr:hypothetical protein D1007_35007 [Hordeum vulgare]
MPLARTHRLTAAGVLSDRPEYQDVYKTAEVPAAATAARRVADAPARGVSPSPVSVQALHPMCFAHAYVHVQRPAPDSIGGSGNAATFIHDAINSTAPDLPRRFSLLGSAHGTMGLRFRTPADREAAMRCQPFASRDGSGTVELVPACGTAILDDYLAHNIPEHLVRDVNDVLLHVGLRDYPAEQRTHKGIDANCRGFGWVVEVDPACFAAPDLSTVHAVLCVGHPREVPRELRIGYADGSTSVVPVDVLAVWDWPLAFRGAHGRYVRFFQLHDAVARAGSGLQAL